MASAAVDAHATVTVKQHGFHVKQPFHAAAAGFGSGADLSLELGSLPSPGGASSPFRREEGGARGLLNFATPCPAAALPSAAGLSLAPAASACLQPAEHAHLTPGVKRLMKGVVRGLKALQVSTRLAAAAAAA